MYGYIAREKFVVVYAQNDYYVNMEAEWLYAR